MEGYLKVWLNMFFRWKQRYFILHENILIYCDEKGGEKLGSIHLKISSIILIPVFKFNHFYYILIYIYIKFHIGEYKNDPLRIIINSGTKEMHLRAANKEDKAKWYIF